MLNFEETRCTRVSGTFSHGFLAQVKLYQGSVVRPLFCTLLEALSREIKSGCPEELLYADDLGLVTETLEGLKGRLERLKGALESKGLRVTVKKTKVIISSENPGKVTIESKFCCAVSRKVRETVILSYVSFAGVEYIKDVVISEVN